MEAMTIGWRGRLCLAGLLALGFTAPALGAVSATAKPTSSLGTSSRCPSGSATFRFRQLNPQPVCAVVGARLTLKFDKATSAIAGRSGPWAQPPVGSDNDSIVRLVSSRAEGPVVIAQVRAKAVGTAIINAAPDNECTSANSPSCTIPPMGAFWVTVHVVGDGHG